MPGRYEKRFPQPPDNRISIPQFVFPDTNHSPSFFSQPLICASVALNIATELLGPEFTILRRLV